MRKILALLATLALSAPAMAQSIQVPAGGVLGNSTAAQRQARAETITAVLDRAIGSTRGSLLMRGAAGWTQLPPGTVGLPLVSAGAGADPAYAVLGVAGGGTGLTVGTSGGIPYFNSTTTMASSAALAANQLVLGGGAGATPATLGSLGTTTTVLHGNAAGAPSFGAVVSADLNITTTSCVNQFVSAISAGGVGTCSTVSVSQLGGLGTGVATALGVNVGSAGAFVTFNGALGTPSSGALTNATGLPISTGLTGAGTGVLTALGVNVGTAGSFVVNGGALGTPSSGTVTNLTGTASININGTVGATTPTTGAFTTLAWSSTAIGTTSSATAIAVGPNGATNPVWRVDASTASQAAGLKLTGAATGGTVALAAIDSGANTSLSIAAKGTGNLTLITNGGTRATIDSTGNMAIGGFPSVFSGYNIGSRALLTGSNNTAPQQGQIGIVGNQTSDGTIGDITFHNAAIGASDARLAFMRAVRSGANNTGAFQFFTYNAGTPVNQVQIPGSGGLNITPTVVNSLPTCNAAADGLRSFVTNNNTATAFAGAVTTGGANHHPVYCDGSASAWKQG